MKIVIHSLLAVSFIRLLMPINTETPLDELIQFASQHQYQIESGELIIKETFTTNEISQIKTKLNKAGFKQTEQHQQYKRLLNNDLYETVTIIKTNKATEISVN